MEEPHPVPDVFPKGFRRAWLFDRPDGPSCLALGPGPQADRLHPPSAPRLPIGHAAQNRLPGASWRHRARQSSPRSAPSARARRRAPLGALGGWGRRTVPFQLATKHLPSQSRDLGPGGVQLTAQRPVLLAETANFGQERIVRQGAILDRGAQAFHFLPPSWPRLACIGGVPGSDLGLRSGPLAIRDERAVEVATIACHSGSVTPFGPRVQVDYAPWWSRIAVEGALSWSSVG